MLLPSRAGVALRALPCAPATTGVAATASGCRAFLSQSAFGPSSPLGARSPPKTARSNFTTSPLAHTSRTPNANAPAPNPPVAEGDFPPLDWNRFFRLRNIRRRYQLGFSVAGVVLGSSLGLGIVASGSADHLISLIPLDPLVSMGIVTISCGGLGWLGGPALGTALFNIIHRGRLRDQMMMKEVEFFARIKRHRVDPSSSSAQNPVPDFYGERIQSVGGYRQWLRDQRAFNKKRRTFVS